MRKAVKNETANLPHDSYISSLSLAEGDQEGSLSSLGDDYFSSLALLCQSRWLAKGDQEPSPSSPPLVFVFSLPRLFLLLSRARWPAELDQE